VTNYIRWQITRALVWLAFEIAPKGAAKDAYLAALMDTSEDIMGTLRKAERRADPHL
jgi:hypothetical protein